MEFLGIGPGELVFILIIALVILGPRDMRKAGLTLGKWMRRIVMSPGWRVFQESSREIQRLPTRLMQEAALDELEELKKDLRQPLLDNRIAPLAPGSDPAAGNQVTQARPSVPAASPQNAVVPPPVTPTPPAPAVGDKEPNA